MKQLWLVLVFAFGMGSAHLAGKDRFNAAKPKGRFERLTENLWPTLKLIGICCLVIFAAHGNKGKRAPEPKPEPVKILSCSICLQDMGPDTAATRKRMVFCCTQKKKEGTRFIPAHPVDMMTCVECAHNILKQRAENGGCEHEDCPDCGRFDKCPHCKQPFDRYEVEENIRQAQQHAQTPEQQ